MKTENLNRTIPLSVVLNELEAQMLERVADESKRTRSEVVRELIRKEYESYPQDTWISVEDESPKEDDLYLAYPNLAGKVYPVRYFIKSGWRTVLGDDVAIPPVYWKPISEPPERKM